MINKQLTKKQAEIFHYIEKFQKQKNYSPALGNIANYFDVSIPTIHEHVNYLEKKGYLKKQKGKKCSIQPIKNNREKDLINIPILGTIAAGQPIEAIEIPDGFVTIAKDEIKSSEKYYALRAMGDSMIEDGVFNGDMVVIREQKTADNGQMIVAIVDENQATLKRIYYEKNRIRLQPANQTLLPFYRTEVEIRGVVEKIIRNPNNDIKETGKKENLIVKHLIKNK